MKKLCFLLMIATTLTANAKIGAGGGAAIGGVAGAGIIGAGAGLIANTVGKNNIQKAKDSIGCYVNGQKKSGWEGEVQLDSINVDAAKSTPMWK